MKSFSLSKALLSSSALIAISVSPAFAQDDGVDQTPAAAEDQQPAERIVVTGTRIRQSTITSPVSMDVLSVDDARSAGVADISGLLQSSSAAAGSNQITNAVSVAYVSDGGVGAETVGLRGLGAGRTLDLINGRRAGPSGTRGSINAFDLGSIPLVGIERVDVLKDGASSIYGSDAIAGVVNYITDRSDGSEIDFYTEAPFESGGEVFRASVTHGDSFDRGRFRVTADYYQRNELARRDRDYLDCRESYTFTDATMSTRADVVDPRFGTNQCSGTIWGHVWAYNYSGLANPDNVAWNPRNRIFQYDYTNTMAGLVPGIPASLDGTGITAPANWYQVEYTPDNIVGMPAFAGIDISNRNPDRVTDLYPEMQRNDSVAGELERVTVMGDVEYELTDNITAYGEFLFNRRSTYVNNHDQYWSYRYGATDYAGNPNLSGDGGENWLMPGLNIEFSPTPVVEWGDEEVTVEYMRLLGGLRGDLGDVGMFSNVSWDMYVQHSDSAGEYSEQFVRNDSIRSTNYQMASCVGQNSGGASATTNTGETVTVDGVSCVDVRWYDPSFLAGNLTDGERNFLLGTDTGSTDFTQTTFDGYVTGDVWELPQGPMSAALGIFYQRDEIMDRPSDTTLTGNEFFGSSAGITTGEQETQSIYGEVSIPLFGDLPLVQSFSVIASGRYNEITSSHRDGRSLTVDGSNYRFTADWAVNDALRLRGSIGTSFRAPALYEQFLAAESRSRRQSDLDPCIGWGVALGNGDISQTVADNCAADGIPDTYSGAPISAQEFRGGGFGFLKPEESDNMTVGFILTPDFDFANVSFAMDYFEIEINDQISTLSGPQIVNGCYSSQNFASEPLCDLFSRGNIIGGEYRIQTVSATFINIDTQTNRGIDITMNANRDTPWGFLDMNLQLSKQLEDNIQLLGASATRYLNGSVGEPEWVALMNMTLSPTEDLSLRWGMNYVGEASTLQSVFASVPLGDQPAGGGAYTITQLGDTVNAKTEAEAMFYHHVSGELMLDGGWTIRAGINNVFDEHPPALTNINDSPDLVFAGNSPIVSQYDLLGRRAFLNISKTF